MGNIFGYVSKDIEERVRKLHPELTTNTKVFDYLENEKYIRKTHMKNNGKVSNTFLDILKSEESFERQKFKNIPKTDTISHLDPKDFGHQLYGR